MKVFISIDEERNITGWGTSPSSENYIEADLPEDHEVLMAPGLYRVDEDGQFVKDESCILEEVRLRKMDTLSAQCRQSILGYFEAIVNSVPYLFSFDAEAQSNFTISLGLFTRGLTDKIEWTAHRDGMPERVVLNESQFLQVMTVAYSNKDRLINVLRKDKQPQVYAATTIEEIESIQWNEDE